MRGTTRKRPTSQQASRQVGYLVKLRCGRGVLLLTVRRSVELIVLAQVGDDLAQLLRVLLGIVAEDLLGRVVLLGGREIGKVGHRSDQTGEAG